MRAREVGMLVVLAALWGGSFLFIRVAVPVLGPFALIAARVLLAGVALLAYAHIAGHRPALRARWRDFLALGALNAALPFTLIAAAELRLPASLAAILNATTPLFAAVIATRWTGEPLPRGKRIGLALGVLGVAVLVGWSPLTLDGRTVLAVGASLLAALCYALGGVYAAERFRATPPLTLAIGQQLAAGLLLLTPAAFTLPPARPAPAVALAVAALALLSTALGYLLYFALIARVGPTNTLSVTFLVPAFGLLWGALFLGEAVGTGTMVGLALVLLSVTLITGLRVRLGGAGCRRRGNTAEAAAEEQTRSRSAR